MSSFGVLVGASVLAALSLYLFFKLLDNSKRSGDGVVGEAQRGNDPLTIIFALVAFAVFLYSIFLVSKAGLDDFDYCNVLPVNQTTIGNLTTVDYSRVCFDNANSTADSFFKLVNWLIIISGLFLLLALFWNVWLYVKSLFEYKE